MIRYAPGTAAVLRGVTCGGVVSGASSMRGSRLVIMCLCEQQTRRRLPLAG